MWFVYIIRCADGSFYVGETCNIDERLARHNSGAGAVWTAARRPVTLVYTEDHPDRTSALARERQIKGWTRAKKETLIAGNLQRLKCL